jgi:hypothetical protein
MSEWVVLPIIFKEEVFLKLLLLLRLLPRSLITSSTTLSACFAARVLSILGLLTLEGFTMMGASSYSIFSCFLIARVKISFSLFTPRLE